MPGVLGRSVAYAHLLAYKFLLALALLGGGIDGGLIEEPAKGVVGWAEEDLSSPQPRPLSPGACGSLLIWLTEPLPNSSSSLPRVARPTSPPKHSHSLPNGLRAPLRC
jgi:hypothetical protein